MCVSIRNRTLSNDEFRLFSVQTMQLWDYGASGGMFISTMHICA